MISRFDALSETDDSRAAVKGRIVGVGEEQVLEFLEPGWWRSLEIIA